MTDSKLITHHIADDLEILEWDATAYDEPFDIAIRTASSALLSLKITLTPEQTARLAQAAWAAAKRFNVELNVDTETGDLFAGDAGEKPADVEFCICPLPLMEPLCPVHGHSFVRSAPAADIVKHCVCPVPLMAGDCPVHGGTPDAEIARAAIEAFDEEPDEAREIADALEHGAYARRDDAADADPAAEHDDAMTRGPFADTSEDS